MNKYKTQETLCYSLITSWIVGILILLITSSCSTSQSMTKLDKKTGIYHQKNTYEAWSIK
jgi:hypothetical protein